jgi:penicillin amidase
VNTPLSKRLGLLASVVSILALIALVAIGWVYVRVRASLPQLDGTAVINGLGAPVSVERDALGVPTLKAQSRVDVARALGFLHAQDRFFQMDVWRRTAAGELSAVFGKKTFANDRRMRAHGFRKLAQATLAQLPPEQRALVDAYTDGVNAGLAALGGKPFEYVLVRATPEPWKPEDTFLVCSAMLTDLQDSNGQYERTLMTIRNEIGRTGVAALAPLLTPSDAALDGSKADLAPFPSPQILNLRPKAPAPAEPSSTGSEATAVALTEAGGPLAFADADREATPGSNAFALSGAHTLTER